MADPVEKLIQLKDKDGNLLYPKIKGTSIPDDTVETKKIKDGNVTKAKLSTDLQTEIGGKASNTDLNAVKETVDTLNGDASTAGSVKKQIADAISGVMQFDVKVVTELPAVASAQKGVIYLIAHQHSDTAATGAADSYDEYIFAPGDTAGTGKFEKIGNTDLDISGKADKATTYTKTETDSTFVKQASAVAYYEEVTE